MVILDINKLDFIEVKNKERKALAYLNENKQYYIDATSNTVDSSWNQRFYKKEDTKYISSFKEMLEINNLWVMLINSNGILEEQIAKTKILNLFDIYYKLLITNDDTKEKINNISESVVEKIMINILKTKKRLFTSEQKVQFIKLLSSYIYIDMINNFGKHNNRFIIRKEKQMLDYKVLRILKYIGIKIDVNNIPDFNIQYDFEGIKLYEENGKKINLEEGIQKVKK